MASDVDTDAETRGMNMPVRFLSFVVLLCVLVGLTACSSDPDFQNNGSNGTTDTQSGELKFGHSACPKAAYSPGSLAPGRSEA